MRSDWFIQLAIALDAIVKDVRVLEWIELAGWTRTRI